MNKKNLLLSVCLGTLLSGGVLNAHAVSDIDKRRDALLTVINEEFKEVTRLNKQLKNSNPDLLLRLAQVLLEKGRILRDAENQKYLEIPATERSKVNRTKFFEDSTRYFEQAKKTVLAILSRKEFRNFKGKGEAYYILAYNTRESNPQEAAKFFNLALKNSDSNSDVAQRSRLALAETYFNQGWFDKAVPLYEQSLKNKKDKWWTKDALNLARSYSKMKRYDEAIRLMTEAYEMSKDSKYINVKSDVEREIAIIYIFAGRTKEAINFYEKNGKDAAEVLLKIGRHLKGQSKFADAEQMLTDALKLSKNEAQEIEINVELISLYEKFGRDAKHLQACRFLAKHHSMGNLNEDQTETLKFNAEKMGAVIQQQIVKKTYASQPKVLKEKMDAVTEYYAIAAQLDPKKAGESHFLAGEAAMAAGKTDEAVALYAKAIEASKNAKDGKTLKASTDALLSALGKNVNQKTIEAYMIPAYEGFLLINPKGEKSNSIYQRLFSEQMKAGKVADAEKTLVNYKYNYPQENLTQEKMLAQIMDKHRETGNKSALSAWAEKIESKEFVVNPEYASKVKSLMLGMQFEKVEDASKSGDKRSALRGYIDIYKSPDSNKDAKKTAAYNIAVLFYDTGKWKQMNQWAGHALDLMSADEVKQFEANYIVFTTDLFQRRKFDESAQLSEKVFDKTCATKSPNLRTFFKNANVIYLSQRQFDKSLAVIEKAKKCGISNDDILPGYVDHLNELAAANKWGSFNEVIKQLEASQSFWPQLIYPTSLLKMELENVGRMDDAEKLKQKMNAYYETSKKAKLAIPVEGLDVIGEMRLEELDKEFKKLSSLTISFPENVFQKSIKAKFDQVAKISALATKIAELGSGKATIKAYKYSVMALEDLRDEILGFTPPGKSEEWVTSFKKDMQKLVSPLNAEAKSFRETAISQIEKNNILSEENSWFLVKNDGIIPEYFSTKGSVLMDKAGAR